MSSSDLESDEQVIEEGTEEEDEDSDEVSDENDSDNEATGTGNDDAEDVEEEESESDISESEDESDSDREVKKKNSKNCTPAIEENAKATAEFYAKLKGKQLFVLFPHKLPTDVEEFEAKAKGLHELITKAIRPRQKSCRHCLVQFENEDDRSIAMKDMSKIEIDGAKLVIKLSNIDKPEYVERMVARKALKTKKLREKVKLKRLAKKQQNRKQFTSTINVTKIPSSITAIQIKNLFPEAVDFRFNCAKGVENTSNALVTLPTPEDASLLFKKNVSIEGHKLKLHFAKPKKGEANNEVKSMPTQQNNNKTAKQAENTKKQPAPNTMKRKLDDSTNDDNASAEKKSKTTPPTKAAKKGKNKKGAANKPADQTKTPVVEKKIQPKGPKSPNQAAAKSVNEVKPTNNVTKPNQAGKNNRKQYKPPNKRKAVKTESENQTTSPAKTIKIEKPETPVIIKTESLSPGKKNKPNNKMNSKPQNVGPAKTIKIEKPETPVAIKTEPLSPAAKKMNFGKKNKPNNKMNSKPQNGNAKKNQKFNKKKPVK